MGGHGCHGGAQACLVRLMLQLVLHPHGPAVGQQGCLPTGQLGSLQQCWALTQWIQSRWQRQAEATTTGQPCPQQVANRAGALLCLLLLVMLLRLLELLLELLVVLEQGMARRPKHGRGCPRAPGTSARQGEGCPALHAAAGATGRQAGQQPDACCW